MPSELQGFPLRLMKTGATLRLCKLQELFPLLLQVLSFHTCTDQHAEKDLGGRGCSENVQSSQSLPMQLSAIILPCKLRPLWPPQTSTSISSTQVDH